MAGIAAEVRDELARCGRSELLDVLAPLSRDNFVTWYRQCRSHNCDFEMFFFRPEGVLKRAFGLDREIVAIVAPYDEIQRRLVQAVESQMAVDPALGRVDPLVWVLVSGATNLLEFCRGELLDAAKPSVIVPVRTDEQTGGEHFLRRRFGEYLAAHNFFDITSPIQSDTFFFGRSTFAGSLVKSLVSGENVGLFGLRKMGKTSQLYKLDRMLQDGGYGKLHYLDLQNRGLNQLRYWELLERVIEPVVGARASGFTEADGASRFQECVEYATNRWPKKHFIFALDEIEHIMPGLADDPHWERDFLWFWKTIRSVQSQNRHMAVIVAGVNATAIEQPLVSGQDNPLFSMAGVEYLPPLTDAEVAQMATTLGRYMGVCFEDDCLKSIHAEYGGHPLLTRLALSRLYERAVAKQKEPPFRVTKMDFDEAREAINRRLAPHASHILSLLKMHYSDEYEMLSYLASGRTADFVDLANSCPQFAQHLEDYGVVDLATHRLLMPFLGEYVLREARLAEEEVSILGGSDPPQTEEEWLKNLAETGSMRNSVERRLRLWVKNTLTGRRGAKWRDAVLAALDETRRAQVAGKPDDELLDSLHLRELTQTILKHWGDFSGIEALDKGDRLTRAQFTALLQFLDDHRPDAHAGQIPDNELSVLRSVVVTLGRALTCLGV